jgi:DNA (cytosine-5)-methyltransferase 1
MIHGLDLFSGIGGISSALAPWVRPLAYCEIDRYSQSVLLSRMSTGLIHYAPIWDDINTLDRRVLGDVGIDIIFGGFPCQDISAAGAGAGMEQGARSGLFFQISRLVEELRPAYVFLENVPAIRTRGLSRVLSEFTSLRYDCRWTVVSAADVGAPHLRKRWFLLAKRSDSTAMLGSKIKRGKPNRDYGSLKVVANTGRARSQGGRNKGRVSEAQGKGASASTERRSGSQVANAQGVGRIQGGAEPARITRRSCFAGGSNLGNAAGPVGERVGSEQDGQQDGSTDAGWWSVEPDVGRVANGISHRVDRLRGLGNSVVPLQTQVAFQKLMGLK